MTYQELATLADLIAARTFPQLVTREKFMEMTGMNADQFKHFCRTDDTGCVKQRRKGGNYMIDLRLFNNSYQPINK